MALSNLVDAKEKLFLTYLLNFGDTLKPNHCYTLI